MRFLFLILLVLAPGRTEAQVRWQHDTELFDGVPLLHWPVWARPGNDNIISRVKIFGQNHA